MKKVLLEKIKKVLDENNYQYVEYNHGCFDIIARDKEMFLIKIVGNVGSFQREQSENMKILSSSLDAKSLLVGVQTRREKLKDGILYERFGVPTVNFESFKCILENDYPFVYRLRGGLFASVNKEKLKRGRKNKGLSQKELAEKTDTTKKSIYEHEKTNKLVSLETVEKIESLLGEDIKQPVKMEVASFKGNCRIGKGFEKRVLENLERVGFATSDINQAPFNIIAKERFIVLSEAETDERKIEKNLPYLNKISKITNKKAIVITDKKREYETPSVEIAELECMEKSRDLKKRL